MNLISSNDYIAHHGIKGQKWGVRRFRNEDGSLTDAGKKRIQRGQEIADRMRAYEHSYATGRRY